jgi:probable rRNA maturation factor
VPRRRLATLAQSLLQTEGWPLDAEVDLWLCSDDEIQALNREYRKQDKATDVLSFPQYEPGERPVAGLPAHLGDVVISVDTSQKQAQERGVSLGSEITWLFLHSVLHLIGYDDDTEEGLQRMIAKATTLISKM